VGPRVAVVHPPRDRSTERFFTDRLPSAYRDAVLSSESVTRSIFEVHTYFAGDLADASQQA
jgi:hypothetical protein